MKISFEKSVIGLVLIYLVLLLSHAFSLPFSADEAHYALYGLKLDWSYFDHPPLVGWLQALALNVGDSEWLLRIIPFLMTFFTLYLLFSVTRQVYGKTAAQTALLIYISMPLLQIVPMGMIPETPLVLLGMMLIKLLLSFQSTAIPKLHLGYWCMLGLLMGLAALSKYTAVTLAFSAIMLLFLRFKFSLFAQVGLYLAGLIAVLLLVPVLLWNYEREWISFVYQLEHGGGKYDANIQNALRMQGGQFLSYGPLVYVAGLIVIFQWLGSVVKQRSLIESKGLVFFLIALPILILFSYMALKGRSLPHWTELGVIALIPVIANWLVGFFKGQPKKFLKWGITSLAGLSVLLVLLVQLLLFNVPIKTDDFKHPLRDLIGWKSVSEEMKRLAQKEDSLFITNWSYASRIAWYARPKDVKVLDTRKDQFDLWFGEAEQGQRGLVLLVNEGKGFDKSPLASFKACLLVRDLPIYSHASLVNHFQIYRCENYGVSK